VRGGVHAWGLFKKKKENKKKIKVGCMFFDGMGLLVPAMVGSRELHSAPLHRKKMSKESVCN
jgi:hypothetical protein